MGGTRIANAGGSPSFIVIPARLKSSRLPRKLLLRETGKTLIQHTYESAARAKRPRGLCVACDDREIFEAVASFGGQAVMTDPNAASGTDRVAEVARGTAERAARMGQSLADAQNGAGASAQEAESVAAAAAEQLRAIEDLANGATELSGIAERLARTVEFIRGAEGH